MFQYVVVGALEIHINVGWIAQNKVVSSFKDIEEVGVGQGSACLVDTIFQKIFLNRGDVTLVNF